MVTQSSLPFELNKRVSFGFLEDELGRGDSLGLQKGLVMFVDARPVCGEGVGFGVPAVEYANQIMFSMSASVLVRNGELVKSYWIDALQRKTWKNRFPIDNMMAYRAVQSRLADAYRINRRVRPTLAHLMRVQSWLGVKLSHYKVTSRGSVEVRYRSSGNRLMIEIDNSRLDKDFTRLLIFNEQSADFDSYEDEFGRLRDEGIGVWEKVRSKKASLTNRKMRVTFRIENIAGATLYRGRELLKPRLDWAGFCYLIPSGMSQFGYTIEIV